MLALCVAVAGGLVLAAQHRLLRAPAFFYTVAAIALLLTPNIVWQGIHGWPFLEVVRGDAAHRVAFQNGWRLEYGAVGSNARAFALEQVLYTNPVAASIWLTGIIAACVRPALRSLRFVAIAYVLLFAGAVLAGAKGYYIIGIYATLTAIGATAIQSFARGIRIAILAGTALVGIAAMPLSLPVLPVNGLIGYSQALRIDGTRQRRASGAAVVCRGVRLGSSGARRRRPYTIAFRRRFGRETAVYADTYGDAGALDFYGPRYGLPPAISSQNNYYLWGTHGYDGRYMIAVGATHIDRLEHLLSPRRSGWNRQRAVEMGR